MMQNIGAHSVELQQGPSVVLCARWSEPDSAVHLSSHHILFVSGGGAIWHSSRLPRKLGFGSLTQLLCPF